MTFNSYIFILAFLPIFVILYLSLGRFNVFASKVLIILGGIVFYVYAGWNAASVFGLSILANYLFSLLIKKTCYKKWLIFVTILFNVGLLLYFKYLNFAIDTINNLSKGTIPHHNLILPLGISFFTFQQIMYIVSVARGEIETKIIDYLAYILFFPKACDGAANESGVFS